MSITISEFINNFEYFKRVKDTGNVIIHLGLSYNFIELRSKFVDELKNDLKNQLMIADTNMDELSAITKFAIIILEDSY